MVAAVFKKRGLIELSDYSLRNLSDDELLIEVGYCGVCGTDRHIYSGKAYAVHDVILGHEYAGTVVDKGKVISGYSIGDKVAVNPNIYCGVCSYCKCGKINYCKNLKALGVNYNGGFAQFSIVPAGQAYLLPKSFPLDIAAFAEPLSCCIRGIHQSNIKIGNSVVIVGGGSIGLLMLQLAKITGSSKVIMIEPSDDRQKIALGYGADSVFTPKDTELDKEICELTSGGPDVVIECAGNTGAVELAMRLPKKGGRVVIFGLAGKKQKVSINLQTIFQNELTISGSLLNPFTFNDAVDLLVSGKINVDKFNSVKVNLENINSIFDCKPGSLAVKYLIFSNTN